MNKMRTGGDVELKAIKCKNKITKIPHKMCKGKTVYNPVCLAVHTQSCLKSYFYEDQNSVQMIFTAFISMRQICSELSAAESSVWGRSKTMKLLRWAKVSLPDSCPLGVKPTQIILVAILLTHNWELTMEGFVVIACNFLVELLSSISHWCQLL